MIIDTGSLAKDEQVYLQLQKLYESAGYCKFKMRRFEEYSLYLENKSFLASENVITFNDPRGKLLALKPDVTLSIVKNAKATEKNGEKVYYRENVYRLDPHVREYKEINQIGLEYIGDMDLAQTLEICSLALKSLAAIDPNFIFAVSDMNYIGGLLDSLGTDSETAKKDITACLRSKNAHDLAPIAEKYSISQKAVERVAAIAAAPSGFSEALAVAEKCAANDAMRESVQDLKNLYKAFVGTEFGPRMRLDFSILNDIDYYNGIIFQGFVEGFPRTLLSGGRYDRLLAKFKKKMGAMGFALALDDLNAYYPSAGKSGVDVVLLYGTENAQKAFETAETIRKNGESVLLSRELPADAAYGRIERTDI